MAFDPKAGGQPPPPADLPVIPGITLNYEIARGGMGVVYSGRQDFLDRRVAVKLLSRDLAGEKFAQRFRREAKILAGIKHPHIVACHSAGTTDDGQSYLVMEFVDGPSLKAWIQEHGAVPSASALRMTRGVAQALAHAHTLEVIHRDVKAENILLESITSTAIDIGFPFLPKLVDLGLARMTSETVGFGLTSPGSVMGTPATMSPEQFDDPDSVDFRTDIYGLGCVLYEMLVGAPAYRGSKLTDIVTKKRQPIGPNPCDECRGLPAEVGALVRRMLAADRDYRPGSYKELDDELAALLAALPAQPAPRAPARPVVGDSTGATIISDRGGSRKPVAPTTPPAPVTNKGTPSGPGLLRTAEIDFLQEGLGLAAPRTAFHEGGTGNPASAVGDAAQPIAASTNQATGATWNPANAAPSAPSVMASHKRRMLVAGAGVLLLGGGGLAWMTMGGGDHEVPPVDPVSTNKPPKVVIVGPERVALGMKGVTLEATATDPEGARLAYHWSATTAPEVTFRNEVRNTVQVVLMDGLPGETFAVEVAVDDGTNKRVTATKVLTLDATDFVTQQFLLGCLQGNSQWVAEPPEGPLKSWTWREDRPTGWLSCRALGAVRTLRRPMPDEAFWKVEGRLGSRRDDHDPEPRVFAETIVRLELGEVGWSLHCKRAGDFGESWSIELMRSRLIGGYWLSTPIELKSRRVEWTEKDEAKELPFADLSITRRRETLLLRFGRFADGLTDEYEVAIPPDFKGAPTMALSVAGYGAGEFRGFTLW